MTTAPSEISNQRNSSQITLKNLVLGILIMEKSRIFLMFLFFLINSISIYWLSAYLVEHTAYQIYINPTIVLYVRILIMSIPVIVGLLFGAPLLANQYESGTFQYLFTQGVKNRRLLRVLLGVYPFAIVADLHQRRHHGGGWQQDSRHPAELCPNACVPRRWARWWASSTCLATACRCASPSSRASRTAAFSGDPREPARPPSRG